MNTECCTWVVNPGDKTIEDCYLLIPNKKAAVAHLDLCTYGPKCGACQQSLEILWEEENEG
jgi:hypothetical protein